MYLSLYTNQFPRLRCRSPQLPGRRLPPSPGTPAVTPGQGADPLEIPLPGEDAPEEDTQQEPPDENAPDAPGGPGEQEIPDNEVPQDEGPADVVDLDDNETPMGAYDPGDQGTIVAANREKIRYALLTGGIGLAALIAIAAGAYTYRKMHKARTGKPGDRESEK